MYPGIWTGIFVDLPLEEALAQIAAAGWNAVEFSDEHLDRIMNEADPQAAIGRAREAAARLNLRTPQAHAHLQADVANPDAEQRRQEMDWILRHCEIAAALGAHNMVIHPGTGEGLSGREAAARTRSANAESFRALCDRAGELGLCIGVENMYDSKSVPGARRYGAQPEELLELLDRVNAPNLGITVDTSHANLQRLDLPAAIRAFGKRILCTHFSDNDGSGDQHRVPGSGQIDWSAVMSALADTGYDGILNLEIPGERHPDPVLHRFKLEYARRVCAELCARAG